MNTVGDGFPPSTTVHHGNESWAAFGQVSAEVTEGVKITGGLRYTEDDKDFYVVGGNLADDRVVSDERLSWDLSVIGEVSPDFNLFARVASGFRAPTIRGRDVAFFSPPSVATSEKIMSYEAGFKSELAGRSLRLNGAVFYYTVDDPQFTAVGGVNNLVQLVNADKGKASGFELDAEFQPTDNFVITAGLSYNDTEIRGRYAGGGHLRPVYGDRPDRGDQRHRSRAGGRQPVPQCPQVDRRHHCPLGHAGKRRCRDLRLHRLDLPGRNQPVPLRIRGIQHRRPVRRGLRIGYAQMDGSWEIAAFARNITNEHNVKGGIDFNNNTAFVNEPRCSGFPGGLATRPA